MEGSALPGSSQALSCCVSQGRPGTSDVSRSSFGASLMIQPLLFVLTLASPSLQALHTHREAFL